MLRITTDGCATVKSEVPGAIVTIQEEVVNAIHAPCFNHALNLSISRSSRVKAVKNAVAAMQECLLHDVEANQ